MNIKLLAELCQVPGAPGHEDRIREVVVRELKPIVDDIHVDNMGNVIARRNGSAKGKKLMLAAHMDEISFLVKHIDENGFLRFATLGGFDAKTLTAQRVIVHTRNGDVLGVMGSKPVHLMSDEERKAAPKIENYFIDLGLPRRDVVKTVRVGDTVTRERAFTQIGNMINTKSLDDRVGVFVMIEAVRKAKRQGVDLYAVASVQEEVGLRGATAAANYVQPDIAIALDVTLANDVPDSKPQDRVCELGKGAAIKIMDSSVIAHRKLVDFMQKTAESKKIPYQLEVLTAGGTDTAAMQKAGPGAIAGCISVPTRYVHSVIEMCHQRDVRAAIDLLAAVISGLHRTKLNWA
jgi:endoglucanase